jgi:hypothetical protein
MVAPSSGSTDVMTWLFDVDDKASPKMDNIEKKFGDLKRATSDTNKQFSEWEAGVRRSSSSMNGLASQIGIISGLMGSLATKGIDAIIKFVDGLINFAKASVDLRARVDTLGVSLNNIAANSGYAREEISKFEEAVKKKGITTRQARESLIQMAQAELDLTKAADLARVAQDAAVNAGITSADAFDRIVRSIVTLQPEIVRNLNLNVSLQSEYEKFAVQLGKTSEQLTLSERKQAAMNAVLQAGTLIAGTYEASMGSVGKQSKSTERYLEELQMKIGGLFQPAYFEKVMRYNDLLKELNKFLDDHEKDIDVYARKIGNLFGAAMDMIAPFVELVKSLYGVIESIGEPIIEMRKNIILIVASMFGENAKKYVKSIFDDWKGISGAIDTATKIIVLFGAYMAGAAEYAKDLANYITASFGVLKAMVSGNAAEKALALDKLKEAKEDLKDTSDVLKARDDYMRDAINRMPELVDGYKEVAEAAEQSSKVEEIAAQKLADALALTTAKFKALKEQYDEMAIERQIKLQREAIEEEIRLQWDREDREREHNERVKSIMEGAAEQEKRLIEEVNDAKLQIEEDYRKRLLEIQKDFEFQSTELARKRDAIGLLALIRQNKRTLDNEKDAYNERRKKAEESYRKAVENLDKSLNEQLKKLAEAEQKQLESYQRNLDRQKVLKDLHNKWEQEDRDRAQQKALRDIIKFYMSLDGATKQGLTQLLKDWNWYFDQLDEAITAYNNSVGVSSTPSNDSNYYKIKDIEKLVGRDLNGDGVIGQAGQVSQMLVNNAITPGMIGSVSSSRLPAVSPTRTSERREIHLSGDVSGMDPYIQRVLVNSLMEIERNRG